MKLTIAFAAGPVQASLGWVGSSRLRLLPWRDFGGSAYHRAWQVGWLRATVWLQVVMKAPQTDAMTS